MELNKFLDLCIRHEEIRPITKVGKTRFLFENLFRMYRISLRREPIDEIKKKLDQIDLWRTFHEYSNHNVVSALQSIRVNYALGEQTPQCVKAHVQQIYNRWKSGKTYPKSVTDLLMSCPQVRESELNKYMRHDAYARVAKINQYGMSSNDRKYLERRYLRMVDGKLDKEELEALNLCPEWNHIVNIQKRKIDTMEEFHKNVVNGMVPRVMVSLSLRRHLEYPIIRVYGDSRRIYYKVD